jgi:uncharacterized protein
MEILRLIVTGAPGVGKSTFIRSISELEVVNTNRKTTDGVALFEKETTSTLDFGRFKFNPDMVMHLYGPPGQAGFEFLWQLLTHRAHACIMLLAAHRPREFFYSRRLLSFLMLRMNVPVIIGLTHTDHPDAWSVENVTLALGFMGESNTPPIIPVNSTQKASVAQILTVLVEHLIETSPSLKREPSLDRDWRTPHSLLNNQKVNSAVSNAEQVTEDELVML